MNSTQNEKPFNLRRWFAWLSPVAILLIAVVNAWLISSFLNNHLFQREAAISREFIQNILISDGTIDYISHPDDPVQKALFENTSAHLTNMHDVLRTNLYGVDQVVVWSSDPTLIGKHFSENDELEDALRGELVVHAGELSDDDEKSEHVGLNPDSHFFVESYIPIQRPGDGKIVGVVELYKAPLALTQAIDEGRIQVVLTALFTSFALYLCLYGLIRRADRTIKKQHLRLIEAETLTVVGELTASVAHNIRNPLSSIRSSAEVILEFPRDDCSEQANDIVREVDRISQRVTELLRISEQHTPDDTPVDLQALLASCVADHQAAFAFKGQTLRLESAEQPAPVAANRTLLLQAFHSLLSNSAEAMGEGGECVVRLSQPRADQHRIEISDAGCGMDDATRENVFRPFFTTKPSGLGLGLPLARRIVERFGGTLALESRPGLGTTVIITFPAN